MINGHEPYPRRITTKGVHLYCDRCNTRVRTFTVQKDGSILCVPCEVLEIREHEEFRADYNARLRRERGE